MRTLHPGPLSPERAPFGGRFAASVPTFAHWLRKLGYHTALIGRMHFIGRKPMASPAEGWGAAAAAQQAKIIEEAIIH